jgi:hypothetical protein
MWAFSDESERPGTMLLSVVLIRPADMPTARVRLNGLLLPGQRRVHMAKESARRRRTVLDTLARTSGLSATVILCRRSTGVDKQTGRHLLLQAATGLVVGSGATAWILDNQNPVQAALDRASIAQALGGVDRRLHPTYDHRPSRTEPLLWAADVVCWAVGAGGDWRRRLGDMTTVRELRP